MKYRIKIVTYQNSRKGYTPQYKSRIGWVGIDYDGNSGLGNGYELETRERALDRIDKHYKGNTKKQSIVFEYINPNYKN